jgi:hypothetical protein
MTAPGARAMRDRAQAGEGEGREAAQRRRRWLIVGGLIATGVVAGYLTGDRNDGWAAMLGPPSWSPAVAAALASIYLIASIVGSFLMNGVLDEVDRQRGHKAMSFAGTALVIVYPTWYFLWRGGLAAEPVHWMLFAFFWLSLVLATLWYRFR